MALRLLGVAALAGAVPQQVSDVCWYEEGGTKPCYDGDNTSAAAMTFGTGLSGGSFSPIEKTLFAHKITAGHTGVMNHFWSTCNTECEGALTVRYYVDGEVNASIAFEPGMAAGTGFDDPAGSTTKHHGDAPVEAPAWGTKWIGHGAHSSWFNNFKIPFGSSIRVTIQSTDGQNHSGFYMIVRGGLDLPLIIGGVTLPKTARLQLQRNSPGRMENLEVLDMVSVPKGHEGLVFMTALAVNNSGTGVGFLEGCPHLFDPPDAAWPGILLGSGTEDYFDSGWYFNAGEFRLPVAGNTLMVQNKTVSEWSAYRFHEMDPLRFSDGVRLTWRCGEGGGTSHSTDGSGKCYNSLPPEPPPHAKTTLCEWVESYGWVYVWDNAAHNVWDGASGDRSTAAAEEKGVSAPIATPETVDKYFLGKQGADCTDTCAAQSLHCSWSIETHDSEALFAELGVKCANASDHGGKWWAQDQPSFVSSSSSPNSGECLGYKAVPKVVQCSGKNPSVQRVCHCTSAVPPPLCWYEYGGTKPCWDADNSSSTTPVSKTFGTSCAGCTFSTWEKTLFAHKIAPGHTGQMTHFWSTCNAQCESALRVRYYIDGEENASIVYEPGMASGTGFDDPAAPWGTKWIGHGAHSAWFNNFKIPFGSSIRVTIQSTDGTQHSGFYMIVRGGLDLPLVIGGVTLPKEARLQLQVVEGPVRNLEARDIVSVPKGHEGLVFMTALAVNNSGTGVGFLEGCPHLFDPPDAAWPGILLGSGTEDYFDSGSYFNAGEFRLPVAGDTHLKMKGAPWWGINTSANVSEWSAYRFHEMDPLRFADGVRVTWRCGEPQSPDSAPDGGNKCYNEPCSTCPLAPCPQWCTTGPELCEWVQSYGWVYVWPAGEPSSATTGHRTSLPAPSGPATPVHGAAPPPPPPPYEPPTPDATKCWYEIGGTKPCWDADNSSSTTPDSLTFGTSCPGCELSPWEKTLFAHKIAPGHTGQMTHFWSASNAQCESALRVRYYIDGENNASIQFEPGMASGSGFDDPAAPWGTKWIGHGADSAWFNNFKIPFGSSIRVTIQSTDGQNHSGFYMIVRGGLDLPLVIGGVTLPKTARLQLQRFEGKLKPLEWLNVAHVPRGFSGQLFMSTLSVQNAGVGAVGLNFLEGCFHMYDPPDRPFPGTVISTGTEDYFDSAWYFNAGQFHMPVSGYTHSKHSQNGTEWSGYRFHEMDPLRFEDGLKFQWRCGDLAVRPFSAPNGGSKCYCEHPGHAGHCGGATIGTPTCDMVKSYGWVYLWPKPPAAPA